MNIGEPIRELEVEPIQLPEPLRKEEPIEQAPQEVPVGVEP